MDKQMQNICKTSLESFLQAHYSNPYLKFEDVTRHFRLSKSHGYALFKKHLGAPFGMCLQNVRLSKAKDAMKNTPYSITEIAYMCGFTSLSTFSKVFKQKYGDTPTTYRKKMFGIIPL